MYFQDIILTLQHFWTEQGCILLQPYDMEVGAGTSSPATSLKAVGDRPWNVAYVQPCRRPTDGRYGENPNRMQHYYQFQVIMKPSPHNLQDLCLKSFNKLGLKSSEHDFRFVEDDWKNPTLGAWGLGWEVWCDGMEILQFTFMQQLGGMPCTMVPGELTYGLERIAMYLQGIDSVWDIKWNKDITYKDVFLQSEVEYCHYHFTHADVDMLRQHFLDAEKEGEKLLQHHLAQPAYDQCLKASHLFNVLEARGVLSVTEREAFIAKVRNLTRKAVEVWVENTTATK